MSKRRRIQFQLSFIDGLVTISSPLHLSQRYHIVCIWQSCLVAYRMETPVTSLIWLSSYIKFAKPKRCIWVQFSSSCLSLVIYPLADASSFWISDSDSVARKGVSWSWPWRGQRSQGRMLCLRLLFCIQDFSFLWRRTLWSCWRST